MHIQNPDLTFINTNAKIQTPFFCSSIKGLCSSSKKYFDHLYQNNYWRSNRLLFWRPLNYDLLTDSRNKQVRWNRYILIYRSINWVWYISILYPKAGSWGIQDYRYNKCNFKIRIILIRSDPQIFLQALRNYMTLRHCPSESTHIIPTVSEQIYRKRFFMNIVKYSNYRCTGFHWRTFRNMRSARIRIVFRIFESERNTW